MCGAPVATISISISSVLPNRACKRPRSPSNVTVCLGAALKACSSWPFEKDRVSDTEDLRVAGAIEVAVDYSTVEPPQIASCVSRARSCLLALTEAGSAIRVGEMSLEYDVVDRMSARRERGRDSNYSD